MSNRPSERTINIQAQLACAQRELALRKAVYPKWVANKRMAQEKADHEIAAMVAIVTTLQTLATANEQQVLFACGRAGG